MASQNTHGAFGEVNRKYWDSQVERISKEPWIQNLARQILDHLRSNLPWLGIQEPSSTQLRLLDYACGPGIVSKALLPYCTEIRGIDVSEGMVNKFNAEAREAGTSEAQMRAVRGDLLAPPGGLLEDREFYGFDLAVMSMALHHVDDPKAMIAKLVERVKPGGIVVIIDWVVSDEVPFGSHGNHGMNTHGHEQPQSSHHNHNEHEQHSHEPPQSSHHNHDGHGHEHGHGHGHSQHAASHTLSSEGFSQEQIRALFLDAGCRNTDIVLAAAPSDVPHGRTGHKQMFFAKGTK